MDAKGIGSKHGKGTEAKRHWWIGGVLALFLVAGGVLWRAQDEGWDLSWAVLTGKPMAVVNGEEISLADFRKRLGISRGMLERQYGKGLFSGGQGEVLLAELEANLLERMVQERLVDQEARRLKIAVTDAQVTQEIEAIGREVYGSPEHLQASLRGEGVTEEYLFGIIRSLLLRKEVDQSKLARTGQDGAPWDDWLVRARQAAKVEMPHPPGPSRAAGKGPCGEPPGAAGGDEATAGGSAEDPKDGAATAGPAVDRKPRPGGKGGTARAIVM